MSQTVSSPDYFLPWHQAALIQQQIANGLTGFSFLDDAFLSIETRLYLIQRAQSSLDLQYYIFNANEIGQLMLSALLKAATRGVHIRLLLDDQNGTQLDAMLVHLSAHPNISIKVFNPYKFRYCRILDMFTAAGKINRRMHNKLLIADGQIAITGGRNISNEYFEISEDFNFSDLDVVFMGASMAQVRQCFDVFWHFELSQDFVNLIHPYQKRLKKEADTIAQVLDFEHHLNAVQFKAAHLELQQLLQAQALHWVEAKFIFDPPAKVLGRIASKDLLLHQTLNYIGDAKHQLDLVFAYFVPTEKGLDTIIRQARLGTKIRIITNSYAANDVAIVHAFYQKYRVPLLREPNIELYEFKPRSEPSTANWLEKITGRLLKPRNKFNSRLHAKFCLSDNHIFIGSFNFDPRSYQLNTELGLVIHSQQLTAQISRSHQTPLHQIAYQVKLNPQQQLRWYEYSASQVIEHQQEPNMTFFQRFILWLVQKLPIEWLM